MATAKVLYKRTVDCITGSLIDVVERESKSGSTYLELQFDNGTIQMPCGFHINFDLVQNATYSAKWESGKFTIVEGSEIAATTEDSPF